MMDYAIVLGQPRLDVYRWVENGPNLEEPSESQSKRPTAIQRAGTY